MNEDDDFGFSEKTFIEESTETKQIRKDFQDLEAMILPLFKNLSKNAKTPTINWPNRKEELDKKTSEFLKITRKYS